jgi:hypothetical protein
LQRLTNASEVTFRGSRHLKDDEMSALFQLAGAGDMNGEASADETSYHETVSSGALALGPWLERERLAFTAEQFNVQTLRSEQAMLHREETTRKGEDETLIMALAASASWPPGRPRRARVLPKPPKGEVLAHVVDWRAPVDSNH